VIHYDWIILDVQHHFLKCMPENFFKPYKKNNFNLKRFSAMKHISFTIQTIEELKNGLEKNKTHIDAAQSILAQIYTATCDPVWIRDLCKTIEHFDKRVIIAGATTAGEICEGRSITNTTVVSVSLFQSSSIVPFSLSVIPGSETEAGKAIAHKIQQLPSCIKGLLLLSTPMAIDCNAMIKTLYALAPGLPLFGAGAADYANMINSFVFTNNAILDSGLVAVALTGKELHLSRHTFLGWESVGKTMTITKAKGFAVYEVDHQPAFNLYKKYLGIEADEQFLLNALDFPLLVKRGKHIIARVPVAVGEDGGITFIADIHEGERFRLGYCDLNYLLSQTRLIKQTLAEFAPQGIYLYSCAIRRLLLEQDIDLELQPYEEIAPSAGFFTCGEFCGLDDQSQLLNATIVIAALREGNAEPSHIAKPYDETKKNISPYQLRHNRILTRFNHHLNAVTKDLVAANTQLQKQLDEIKTLRGILPICAACKKIRDDSGYWNQIEAYLYQHSEAAFSHSICPDCTKKLYPDFTD
jgi:hypothetical protein